MPHYYYTTNDIYALLVQMRAQLMTMATQVATIVTKENQIMTDLTDLQDQMNKLAADVTTNTTDTGAAVAEIKSLLDQIAAGVGSGATPAELQALTAQASTLVSAVETSNAALAAAIPAPTP